MAYVHALRRQRSSLRRELPDVDTLLSTEQLKKRFTKYEKEQICAPIVPSDRVAKLLDCLEVKGHEVYEGFVSAVRPLKPNLAAALEATEREVRVSSATSAPRPNGSTGHPCE